MVVVVVVGGQAREERERARGSIFSFTSTVSVGVRYRLYSSTGSKCEVWAARRDIYYCYYHWLT